jgi:glycosyltransferase involved in cell wall biosynthesis
VPYLVGQQSVPERKTVVIQNALPETYGTGVEGDRAELAARFGVPSDSVLVLFLGNLFKHKGLHRIVRALAEMPDRPWHLVVAGVGPERDPCARRLEQAGLKGRATFLGRLDADDVERVLTLADVLTLPSSQEGMPYVILEAMASGVPVLSTAVYGIPEMVLHGETGLLVDPSDGGGLRDALALLIDRPEMRDEMGRAARLRFEAQFTLDRQIRAVESMYLNVARVAPRRGNGEGR